MARMLSFPVRPFVNLAVFVAVPLASLGQSAELGGVPAPARSAYQQGLDAEALQQFDLALERFQLALKQAGNCLDCLEGIATVQQAMGNDKAALSAASKMLSASGSPKERARADMLTGRVYYEEYLGYTEGEGAYDKSPRKAHDALEHAEGAYARAVHEDPTNEQALMLDGHLQAALQRDSEAKASFAACAALPGLTQAECARALRFSKNVDIARNEPAPPFEAVDLDGNKVSLGSLAGKIVLLDFWGTWCPVCRSDADYVQSLVESFPKDRFVLLEVDSGDPRETWANYIQKNRLHGVQVQDDHHQLQSLFRITAFPTYVLLDGDGTVRMRVRGARGDLRGEIRKLLAQSIDTREASVASAPTAP
jgi:thiol-disulfide isomerase/thioredoxin